MMKFKNNYMNRLIKFRAWDKANERMIYKSDIYQEDYVLVLDLEGDLYDNAYGRFGDGNVNKSFEILQFTGLKDKNGVEVYEGDIVRVDYKSHGVLWAEVVYYKNGFYLGDGLYSDFAESDYEVVGNIFENANLLEN